MNEINVYLYPMSNLLDLYLRQILNFAKKPSLSFGRLGCEILAFTMLFGKIGCVNLTLEIDKIDQL